ncbi:3-dehydroquinate synthase [Barrientosiimonas marina]|uniref:3-dehydroquinate synthase n=1 Tax=Lentibacillus kimchii TaxID=1542911 RepID=A0ABW2UZ02_9BACI
MNVTHVRAATHTYNVYVGENLRHWTADYLPKTYPSILIVTDEKVARYYLEDVKRSLSQKHVAVHTIQSGESAKSIDVFYELQTKAIEFGLERNSLIIALGGGVVGDVAGFVAATFMRGIDYVQMPTTILAHDSSVGGKVAINHEQGKNMIGSFHAPAAVIYDVTTLATLTEQEIRSGYAELLKEALLSDSAMYEAVMANDLSALTSEKLSHQLISGIDVKAAIVEADEYETDQRKFLNLGHTLGHALETILGYGSWTHGELVAIGLLFAIWVSEKIYGVKLPYNAIYRWLKSNGYPLKWPSINSETIFTKMKSDKKTVSGTIQMVLLQKIGHPVMCEIDDRHMLSYLRTFQNELLSSNEQGGKQHEK